MNRYRKYFLVALLLTAGSLYAQVWHEPPLHRLTLEEYEHTLAYWQRQSPDRFTYEKIGQTLEGEGIYLAKVTNRSVPDNNKQVALITSIHGGPERSGVTGTLAVLDWLLGNDPLAVETRNRQLVLFIPIVNPYGFFNSDRFGNSAKIDPYNSGGGTSWDFTNGITYNRQNESPEVKALLHVFDTYRPDVNLDIHGTGMQEYKQEHIEQLRGKGFRGQIMFEVTGTAYSNSNLRPWDWRITEAMLEAGKKEGFPSDRAEADAQQMHWSANMQPVEGQLWRGRPLFYTAQYAYLKYHTLLSTLEVAWEQSAVARAKGLFRIGNRVWAGENVQGYPVNKVHAFVGKFVVAYGKNATERRNSRVNIWQQQAAFNHGIAYPEVEGRESFFVGLTPKGNSWMHEDLDTLVERIKQQPGFNIEAIASFLRTTPYIKFAFERSTRKPLDSAGIKYGMGLRVRVPYENARLKQVRLNGHLLKMSVTDGYEAWKGDGYLQVQVNIPPAKAAGMDMAILTCEYEAGIKRSYGWTPPKAVLDQLKKK